jgi:hypothetical protein
MDQARVEKESSESKSEGREKLGRFRGRLKDVENDLQELKVKRLKLKLNDREEWASVVKGAQGF